MTAFNSLSHGTQDVYPTFLQKQLGLSASATSTITILQYWCDHRRYALWLLLSALGTPPCHHRRSRDRHFHDPFLVRTREAARSECAGLINDRSLFTPIHGAGCMGNPVHLNELSPTDVRGTFPGFAYQLGNLFAAFIVTLESIVAFNVGTTKLPNYGLALALFSACF